MEKITQRDKDSFFIRINVVGECWIWTGGKSENGYGLFYVHRKVIKAHRFSYLLFYSNPKSLHVLHKCDTPLCVNPNHLFLGTDSDNIKDKVSKGRQAKGLNVGIKSPVLCTVTNNILTLTDAAKLSGYSITHIHKMVHGKRINKTSYIKI